MIVAPGCQKELQTGASRTPATGGRSGSDPVAASEEEHPLHDVDSTALGASNKRRVMGGGRHRAAPAGPVTERYPTLDPDRHCTSARKPESRGQGRRGR